MVEMIGTIFNDLSCQIPVCKYAVNALVIGVYSHFVFALGFLKNQRFFDYSWMNRG